ncbi:MAG: type II secretion system F family protein [Elusimicrobiales bacterium]|nr:type II secretion system F family protein [Elusimicrobiales bacterium]
MIQDERLLGFCRALTAALKSGLALSDAFATLAKTGRHGRHIGRAGALAAAGSTLHEAFAAQGVFPKVFLALLRAGEESGKTDEFLELYADCLQTRIEFRRRIERLLVYPAFAALAAAALLLLTALKVMPMLLEPLASAGVPLPPQALLITSWAAALYANWPPALLTALAAILLLRAFVRSALGRKAGSLAGHFLPLFRFSTQEARLYYQYTIMGLLFKAGLPLGSMLSILQQFSQDDFISRRRFFKAEELAAAGRGFTESLAALVPQEDRHSLEVAEKAGRLDDTLLCRGKVHYDLHLHRLKLLVTAFNISTLAGLAVLAFGLIVAMIWPVLAVLGGGERTLPLSPERPAVKSGQAQTEPGKSAAAAATRLFNERQGGKISGLIQEKSAGPDSARRKKLQAPARMNKIQFNSAKPAPDTH